MRYAKSIMYPELERTVGRALGGLDMISEPRKHLLDRVAAYVSSSLARGSSARLTFICTHNSRRSHMGQLWAAVGAAYRGVDGVLTYSGGTETTAFNSRAVAALERAGFVIENPGGENPHYRVTYSAEGPTIECFSKRFDDPLNPVEGFAAIMTCAEADEACPVIHGADLRVPLRYEDPKVADGTPNESAAYDERSLQIATEMLYLFSRVA